MRQNFIGMVVSTAMSKTVKVKVVSQKLHPIVQKVRLYRQTSTTGIGVVARFAHLLPPLS